MTMSMQRHDIANPAPRHMALLGISERAGAMRARRSMETFRARSTARSIATGRACLSAAG